MAVASAIAFFVARCFAALVVSLSCAAWAARTASLAQAAAMIAALASTPFLFDQQREPWSRITVAVLALRLAIPRLLLFRLDAAALWPDADSLRRAPTEQLVALLLSPVAAVAAAPADDGRQQHPSNTPQGPLLSAVMAECVRDACQAAGALGLRAALPAAPAYVPHHLPLSSARAALAVLGVAFATSAIWGAMTVQLLAAWAACGAWLPHRPSPLLRQLTSPQGSAPQVQLLKPFRQPWAATSLAGAGKHSSPCDARQRTASWWKHRAPSARACCLFCRLLGAAVERAHRSGAAPPRRSARRLGPVTLVRCCVRPVPSPTDAPREPSHAERHRSATRTLLPLALHRCRWPGRPRAAQAAAVLCTFLASAAEHVLFFWVVAGSPEPRWFAFFALHGVLVLCEQGLLPLLPRALRRACVLAVLLGTCMRLFLPPLEDRVLVGRCTRALRLWRLDRWVQVA